MLGKTAFQSKVSNVSCIGSGLTFVPAHKLIVKNVMQEWTNLANPTDPKQRTSYQKQFKWAYWKLIITIHTSYVIYQKRVWVFHQRFQTLRNRWKHDAAGLVLLLFRGVWNPDETRSTSVWYYFSNKIN